VSLGAILVAGLAAVVFVLVALGEGTPSPGAADSDTPSGVHVSNHGAEQIDPATLRGDAQEEDPPLVPEVDPEIGAADVPSGDLTIEGRRAAILRAFRDGKRRLGIELLEQQVRSQSPGLDLQETRLMLASALLTYGEPKAALENVTQLIADAAAHSTVEPGAPYKMRSLFGRGFRTYPQGTADEFHFTKAYAYCCNQVGAPLPAESRRQPELHFALSLGRRLEQLPQGSCTPSESRVFQAVLDFVRINADIRALGLAMEGDVRVRTRQFIDTYASTDDARVRTCVDYARSLFPDADR